MMDQTYSNAVEKETRASESFQKCLLPTQTTPHKNLCLTKLAIHAKCRPYPEYHGGPAQKHFPH